MGITIYYRGLLTDPGKLSKLVSEVEDICRIMNWEYRILDDDWSKPDDAQIIKDDEGVRIKGNLGLKGIGFKPHEKCEWVDLYFDRNRILSSIGTKSLQLQDQSDKNNKSWNSVKTQFASVKTHIAIVKMLRWLKKNYMHDLEVSDEGEYWDTDNADLLYTRRTSIFMAMDSIEDKLNNTQLEKPTPHMSEEEYADYIAKLLENINLETEIKLRGGEIWKSEKIDPYIDNIFMKNVLAFEEADETPEIPMRSLFPADYKFPSVESMDDNQIARKLKEISDILASHNIGYGFANDLPDRVLYKYLTEDCIQNDTISASVSAGFTWVLDGCSGDCESCFQKEYCSTAKEM